MDFGKKDDAKKAMKLMWKEGITLKQAWKRVKAGKKGKASKKRKGMSPKKKKAAANAKKAMKLKWKEGITLKQAWKKVNKFGVTVVPDGMEINPATGRLRKVCLPPNMRNDKGRCVKPKAPVVLKPGYEINPETGKMRKMCLPGQYRDPISGRCKTIKDFSVEPLLIKDPVPTTESLLLNLGKKCKFGNNRKCGFGTCKPCGGR